MLKELAREEDILLRASAFSGPLGLVSGQPGEEELACAAALVASYGKGQGEAAVEILLQQGARQWSKSVPPMDRRQATALQID